MLGNIDTALNRAREILGLPHENTEGTTPEVRREAPGEGKNR